MKYRLNLDKILSEKDVNVKLNLLLILTIGGNAEWDKNILHGYEEYFDEVI